MEIESKIMRVGYVVDLFPSVYQTFVLDEILQLEREGLEIEIFSLQLPSAAPPRHERLQHLEAPIQYLPSPASHPWGYIRASSEQLVRSPLPYLQALALALRGPSRIILLSFLRGAYLSRLLSAHRVQHLHAHFALGANVVAMLAARLCDVAFSFTTHAVDLFVRPVWLRQSLQAARFAVTISEYNRDFIAQACGDDLVKKVHVIHGGIDPTALGVERQPSTGRPRIISVGRLIEKKGHRYLIEALAQLRQKGYDFEAVIAGEGPERPVLTRLIAEHDLAGQVRLLGAVTQDTVTRLYAESDIFVLPCIVAHNGDRDGIPVSLMEAMASGLPVVSTHVSGIPELVTSGENGLLAPSGDVAALADRLARVLKTPSLRQSLGRHARMTIEREFDVRTNTRQLAELFEEACAF